MFGDQLKAVSSSGTKQRRAEAPVEPEEPQKWFRPATKGGKGQQNSNRSWSSRDRQGDRSWDRSWDEGQPSLTEAVSATQVRELLAMLTRLALRQEDSLAAVQADSSFMLYLDTTGEMSMTKTLWEMSQRWKKAERRRVEQSHPKPEGHFDDGPLHGAEVEDGPCPGRQNQAYARETRMANRGRRSEMGLSGMGPGSQGHEERCRQGSDLAQPHAEGDCQAPHLASHQSGTEVPCHPPHGSGVSEQHVDHDGHDQQPRPSSGRALQSPPGLVRLLCPTLDRSPNEATSSAQAAPRNGPRTTGKGPAQRHPATGDAAGKGRGEASREVDRPANLILSNPHNVCYINSVVTGLYWVSQHCHAADVFGSFTSAYRAITIGTKRSPCYIPGLLPWLPLLRGWVRLSSQHDVCEFITHLLSKTNPACFTGSWQARLNDADLVEVRGSGTFAAPLPMDIPSTEHASLQQIINNWHMQETTNALLHPPQFLLIQLKRYIMQGTVPAKLHTCVPLSSGARIQMPCFVGDSLSTSPVVYTLCFAVAHDGLTVGSGHYRCALFPARGAPFLSDDGVPPRLMDRNDASWTESRCYLICLRRAEQLHDE